MAGDAADRAVLDDMAGHGLPAWLWQGAVKAGKAETALSFGRKRMLEETPVWGWRNSVIAEVDGRVAGMVTSYRMPAQTGEGGEDEPVLQPIFELMRKAEGDWYVDALAVHEEWRGRGVARRLLADAVEQAEAHQCNAVCLIVSSDNDAARRLYESSGFTLEEQRPFTGFDGRAVEGKSHLFMRRELTQGE